MTALMDRTFEALSEVEAVQGLSASTLLRLRQAPQAACQRSARLAQLGAPGRPASWPGRANPARCDSTPAARETGPGSPNAARLEGGGFRSLRSLSWGRCPQPPAAKSHARQVAAGSVARRARQRARAHTNPDRRPGRHGDLPTGQRRQPNQGRRPWANPGQPIGHLPAARTPPCPRSPPVSGLAFGPPSRCARANQTRPEILICPRPEKLICQTAPRTPSRPGSCATALRPVTAGGP